MLHPFSLHIMLCVHFIKRVLFSARTGLSEHLRLRTYRVFYSHSFRHGSRLIRVKCSLVLLPHTGMRRLPRKQKGHRIVVRGAVRVVQRTELVGRDHKRVLFLPKDFLGPVPEVILVRIVGRTSAAYSTNYDFEGGGSRSPN